MNKSKITFELCRGFTLDDHFVGTFQDALLRGDRLASRVGNVSLYAYNEDFHTWEPVGTFLGHMRLKNLYGDIFIIKSDYTDIVKATNSAKFSKIQQTNERRQIQSGCKPNEGQGAAGIA